MAYSFDEFLSHFQALAFVGKYDSVDLSFGEQRKHLDLDSTDLDPVMLKVMDYMGQCYTDEEEKMDKGYRLYRVIHYFCDHREELTNLDFAIHREDARSIDMHPELLRAIHELVYCSDDPDDPVPSVVLARAQAIRNSSHDNRRY